MLIYQETRFNNIKYGEEQNGDIQRLKQFIRKCCREINLWKERCFDKRNRYV